MLLWSAVDSLTQEIPYMYLTRERGIRYRSDGFDQLTAKYDAAFGPDAKDGKSMGGYVVELFGGSSRGVPRRSETSRSQAPIRNTRLR